MCLSDLEKEQMKEAEAKLLHLATADVSRVLLSIWRFRQSRHKISPQHRLKMNEVLQAVIASAGSINIEAADLTIKMAAEDALSITDLRDAYQDAAGNILVALWDHFPAEVLARLLESFQNRLLPYHSILHILGKLANKAFAESNVAKINIWEQKLEEYVYRLLTNVSEKIYLEEVSREIMKEEPERKSWDLEKLFLYQYYGFILRATDDSHLVQEHLRSILALSHRGPLEAKGIASALGLAASRHLKEVLDSLDRFLANASMQEKGLAHGSQGPPWDTLLLCFGRVALDIKAEVLPRANMIASQMAMLCTANPQDMDLKKTFLVAVLMLLEAIEATGKAKHLRLTMKTQLVECLTMVIEGEPTQKLANTVRQDAMHIVAQLSKLKPPLEQSRKSHLLRAAFRSVFALPPLDTLEDISAKALFCQTMGTLEGMLQGLVTEDPYSCDLAHMMETMEPWVTSSSIHVRERAVGMATALMKYVASHLNLHLSSDFGRLGHPAAILLALAKDPVETICTSAVQAVSCLYKILFSQKEPTKSKQKRLRWAVRRSPRQSKEKVCPSAPSLVQESIWHMAKGPEDQLFSTQLTSLLLAVLDNLRGSNTETLRASEEVLHAVLQNHARKVERVKEVVATIYTCLQAHPASFWVRKVLLKALGYLLPFHLEEVVHSCLSFSIPVNRQARQLWMAMASGPQVATQVLQILLKSLQVKDPQESNEDILAVSLAAMNVIYECFGIPDYRPALMEMQAQLFIPMLSQVCCVRQLALPKALQARLEDIMKQDPKALTFRSTSVEIIKGLFSLGKDWAVYARIEFQAGWKVLDTPGKFLQGTRLLARAMMECDSPQIRGVFSEAVSILNNEEDEMKKVTALALMVEFLKSPSVRKMMEWTKLRQRLEEGASSSASPAIRGLCLKALGSDIFQPGEVKRLQDHLLVLIELVFSGRQQDVLRGLKDILATLHDLNGQGAGDLTLEFALNTRSFFEDERPSVRASAFALFGQLVMGAKEAEKAFLKQEVLYSLLPVILHLRDQDSTTAMSCKLALLHCGHFLRWPDLHLMFHSLAWKDLLGCLADAWSHLMKNHRESTHIFISQALGYLHHPQAKIRRTAAQFIGHTLTGYSLELSKHLEQEDILHLRRVFQGMASHPDPSMVRFAKNYLGTLQKLSPKKRLSGAGEEPPAIPGKEDTSTVRGIQLHGTFDGQPATLPPDSPVRGGSPMVKRSRKMLLGAQSPRPERRPLS